MTESIGQLTGQLVFEADITVIPAGQVEKETERESTP